MLPQLQVDSDCREFEHSNRPSRQLAGLRVNVTIAIQDVHMQNLHVPAGQKAPALFTERVRIGILVGTSDVSSPSDGTCAE
jgi:hypothetical protein